MKKAPEGAVKSCFSKA